MKMHDLFEAKKVGKKNGGYTVDIEKETLKNNAYRRALYTAKNSQLILMSLKPKEDIGEEVHDVDQFFRIEKGIGKVIFDGREESLNDGTALVVPAGTKHNIINTSSSEELKLYTVYSPPQHERGTVHKTKADAEKSKEHFDGKVDTK